MFFFRICLHNKNFISEKDIHELIVFKIKVDSFVSQRTIGKFYQAASTNNGHHHHHHHHHHQVPDLEQTLAAMPLQTSLSSDNFKKFKPLLCPPVAELQRLSRNVILCLPLSRLVQWYVWKMSQELPSLKLFKLLSSMYIR